MDHKIISLILAANIITLSLTALAIINKKRDTFHVSVIFIALFTITYPIKFLASMFGFSVMNPLILEKKYIYLSIVIFNISLVSFITPLLILPASKINKKQSSCIANSKKLFLFSIVLLLLGALLVAISAGPDAIKAVFSFSQDRLQDRIAERGTERTSSAISALISVMGQTLTLIAVFKLTAVWQKTNYQNKIFSLFLLLSICSFFLTIKGSKFLALLPIFSFVLFLHMAYRKRGASIFGIGKATTYGSLGIVSIGILGVIRGFGSTGAQTIQQYLYQSFMQFTYAFDAPDNLTYILSRSQSIIIGDLTLRPTFQYLTAWVPRFVWPDKPLIYGNLYIQERYLFERFGGHTKEVISPSMPGEMILSGGIAFMILWTALIGTAYGFLYLKAEKSDSWFFPVLYVWLTANIFGLLRSGTGTIGSLLIFSAICLFILILQKFFQTATKS